MEAVSSFRASVNLASRTNTHRLRSACAGAGLDSETLVAVKRR
jgi:hypothetical protein